MRKTKQACAFFFCCCCCYDPHVCVCYCLCEANRRGKQRENMIPHKHLHWAQTFFFAPGGWTAEQKYGLTMIEKAINCAWFLAIRHVISIWKKKKRTYETNNSFLMLQLVVKIPRKAFFFFFIIIIWEDSLGRKSPHSLVKYCFHEMRWAVCTATHTQRPKRTKDTSAIKPLFRCIFSSCNLPFPPFLSLSTFEQTIGIKKRAKTLHRLFSSF